MGDVAGGTWSLLIFYQPKQVFYTSTNIKEEIADCPHDKKKCLLCDLTEFKLDEKLFYGFEIVQEIPVNKESDIELVSTNFVYLFIKCYSCNSL